MISVLSTNSIFLPAQFFGATRHPRAQRFLEQLLSPLHGAGA